MDNPKELYEYHDGFLYRKYASGGKLAGSLAGRPGTRGYWQVKINGKMYTLHHLIWWIFHGYKPEYIDHKDGNPSNNKIENLRECSLRQNQYNSKRSVSNKTGEKGVFWNKSINKYTARISGKLVGNFSSLEEASIAVRALRHKLHAEFARDS